MVGLAARMDIFSIISDDGENIYSGSFYLRGPWLYGTRPVEWEVEKVMWYHAYLILTIMEMLDAVVFACTWSAGVMDSADEGSGNDGQDILWSSNTVTIRDE